MTIPTQTIAFINEQFLIMVATFKIRDYGMIYQYQ